MLGCKPIDSPMNPNTKFGVDEGDLFSDPDRYRRMVGKLIYLTITQPHVVFIVCVVSQFMHTSRQPHWDSVCRILRYLKWGLGKMYILCVF